MCGVAGDFFYVVGGWIGSHMSSVEKLDLATMDQWTEGPDLPYGISEAGAEVYQDSLLIIGGKNGSSVSYTHLTLPTIYSV